MLTFAVSRSPRLSRARGASLHARGGRSFESLERRTHLSAASHPDVIENVATEGPIIDAPPGVLRQDVVLAWNRIMLDANAADHALASPDQGGPTKTSRAFAIVSAAVFDAVNSIHHRYQPYLLDVLGFESSDVRAAVATAAHDTLVELYPQQEARFDDALDLWLDAIPNGPREQRGILLGQRMAVECINDRTGDGSDLPGNYTTTNLPGHHQLDPLNPTQGFHGPAYGAVRTFVLGDLNDFLLPPPPALDSAAYATAFNEVKSLGGDGVDTPTSRTPEQTEIGIYWGYDGTPGLGTPPRLYNQIIVQIAQERQNTLEQNARLLALANLSMADAAVQSWEGKYRYDFWRPIIGVRGADTDGNADTTVDATWMPLGAPRSNGMGLPNFTPPFPAYSSGHATFGAAAFTALGNFYGTDEIPFSFVSDEFNGVTTDTHGVVRPLAVRSFDNLEEAILENARSRIYLGIHWQFDADGGVASGKAIADYVSEHALLPIRGGQSRPTADAAVVAPDVGDTGSLTAQTPIVSELFSEQQVI